jgi:hypothetical protein
VYFLIAISHDKTPGQENAKIWGNTERNKNFPGDNLPPNF